MKIAAAKVKLINFILMQIRIKLMQQKASSASIDWLILCWQWSTGETAACGFIFVRELRDDNQHFHHSMLHFKIIWYFLNILQYFLNLFWHWLNIVQRHRSIKQSNQGRGIICLFFCQFHVYWLIASSVYSSVKSVNCTLSKVVDSEITCYASACSSILFQVDSDLN